MIYSCIEFIAHQLCLLHTLFSWLKHLFRASGGESFCILGMITFTFSTVSSLIFEYTVCRTIYRTIFTVSSCTNGLANFFSSFQYFSLLTCIFSFRTSTLVVCVGSSILNISLLFIASSLISTLILNWQIRIFKLANFNSNYHFQRC